MKLDEYNKQIQIVMCVPHQTSNGIYHCVDQL